jgi:cytochrome P450
VTTSAVTAPSAEWRAEHFDHLSPELAASLHETLALQREECPVTWSDQHGGFWVVTRYEDVLRIAQDWRTFSSAQGVNVPAPATPVNAIPEVMDPPLHRQFKRLINAWFTPAVVAGSEDATRALVTRLIDDVIEDGTCDFMEAVARPLPGLTFFEQVLHAPADEVPRLYELAEAASTPGHPRRAEGWQGLSAWITDLVEDRRARPPVDDVVQAVITAEIDGRPITDHEIVGVIQLLIFGGLETTAGALGQFVVRFCRDPEVPARLRREPDLLSRAVEELLRLDPPFVAVARVATTDAEVGGQRIEAGQRVLFYWASANRDEGEFACPHAFDPERESNRHLSFGAGPHRCAGSNLARMNLRIALEEVLARLHDLRLADGAEPIRYHSVLNRSPVAVPVTFTPGPRVGPA